MRNLLDDLNYSRAKLLLLAVALFVTVILGFASLVNGFASWLGSENSPTFSLSSPKEARMSGRVEET